MAYDSRVRADGPRGVSRLVALCAALAGCGRLSFDARPVDGALESDVVDASPAITSREAEVATFSTTSTMFVEVPGATLMVPPSPGQRWWLLVNGYLTSTSELYDGPEVQYTVDGVPQGIGGTESVEGKPGPWQHFYVFDGTSDWITINVQLRDRLGETTTLSHLHVIAVPLPAASDPLYASSDGPLSVPTGTSTVATLPIDPAKMAQYLLFILDNARESPGTSDVEVTWFGPMGLMRGPDKNPRGPWQSSLYVREVTIGPDPVTMRLDASSNETSEVAYARVLAFDTAGFPAFASSYEGSTIITTETTPISVHLFTASLTPSPQYLAFATMKVDETCDPTVATRGVYYTLDGVQMSIAHKSDNCALDTTYGFIDLVTTAPTSLAAQISSGTGQEVEHQESTLFFLGVP